ncbi:MAG: ABC transporter permease subunit [Planctomycetes bacterium]|nr:ABC transporter permease subunit [Planctomycetota bacterium]
MNALWSIARRDLLAAFGSPLAWLVLACWAFVTNGWFVFLVLYPIHGTQGSEQPLFVDTLGVGVVLLTLLAPALTMNSFASERSQGTMQLLLTVPVREIHLVLGKFLAAWLILGALVAATFAQIAVLVLVSAIQVPHLVAGYLGLLLTCAFFAGLGVWISILVDSVVAAYVLTFGAIAVLLLVSAVGQVGALGWINRGFSLMDRARPFFTGEIRLAGIAWFVAGTAAFLTLAHAALCARRIHG